MVLLNLKMARDKCPPPIRNPNKTNCKIGDMVLIRKHTPKDTFDLKYKPSFRICRKFQARLSMCKTVLERSGECQYNIYNYYTLQSTC